MSNLFNNKTKTPQEKIISFVEEKIFYLCRVEKKENSVEIIIPHQEDKIIVWEKNNGIKCHYGIFSKEDSEILNKLCLEFHS